MSRHTQLTENDQNKLSKLVARYGVAAILDALAVEVAYIGNTFPNDYDVQTLTIRDVALIDACANAVARGLYGVTRV